MDEKIRRGDAAAFERLVEGETVESVLGEKLLAHKSGIRERISKAASGLDDDKRERLVHLVSRISAQHSLWTFRPNAKRSFRLDEQFGAAQRRKFRSKIEHARTAVESALQYLEQIGTGDRANLVLGAKLDHFARPYLREAHAAINSILIDLAKFAGPSKGRLTEVGKAVFSDSKTRARIELMEFFVKQCQLTQSDASRRVAAIGNGLLGWNVATLDRNSANPKRSDAIRKTIRRRTKSQNRDAEKKNLSIISGASLRQSSTSRRSSPNAATQFWSGGCKASRSAAPSSRSRGQ